MGQLLLLCSGRLLLILKTGVRSSGELGLELFDPSSGVNELQFARVEWMANVANVDLQLFAGATGSEAVAATTRHLSFEVLGMDSIFHDRALVDGVGNDF